VPLFSNSSRRSSARLVHESNANESHVFFAVKVSRILAWKAHDGRIRARAETVVSPSLSLVSTLRSRLGVVCVMLEDQTDWSHIEPLLSSEQ
jgi:hypothetical protein